MRAQILDADALRLITPAALAGYARAEGWIRTGDYGEYSDVYAAAGKPEVIVPRTPRLADYPAVVTRLIAIFADAARKDELAVYRDLVEADRDIVRVRASGGDSGGSIALDAGVEIVVHARDMLFAAACAVHAPQPVYRARANQDAIRYMRGVRLGHTEEHNGSFVVTLLAPVPPLFAGETDASWSRTLGRAGNEPLDRKVPRRLMEALAAARAAAGLAHGTGLVAFERVIAEGVSANLCEAVAGLIEQSDGLDISVTFARTRPAPEPQRKVMFAPADADILKQVARLFRHRQPRPDMTLSGSIYKLRRDPDDAAGRVTLKTVVDGKPQSVRVNLDAAGYSAATRAHDAKAPVSVTGDLERIRKRWHMTNARLTGPAGDPGEAM